MVVTCLPATSTIEVWQERTGSPSRCTVQAPHSADAAAELGAGQTEVVAQHPQQRRIGLDIHSRGLAIKVESDRCHAFLRWHRRTCGSSRRGGVQHGHSQARSSAHADMRLVEKDRGDNCPGRSGEHEGRRESGRRCIF